MSLSTPQAQPSTNLQLSSPLYDKLKKSATVILPGLSSLYFTLSQIWGLPAGEQVVGTIAAINLFVGLLINLSTRSYNDDQYAGSILVKEIDGEKQALLSLDGFPEDLTNVKAVKFKINDQT